MEREANSNAGNQPTQELGGQLILKPAPRRGRYPNDDAIFLSHGRGLIQYEFVDYEPPKPHPWLGATSLDRKLRESIAEWLALWQDLDDGLPAQYSPLHCREFDIQNYNKKALAICRALVPLLPSGQQLCYSGVKRKGAQHRSWLLEWGQWRKEQAGPLPAYYGEDRNPEKWVRVMGDYASSGLWAWSGSMLICDDLPVSADLKARIDNWARRYFSENDSWRPGEHDDFARICEDDLRLRDYSDEGLAIARAIKAQAPDWTVVYFDEDLASRNISRSVFQFEVV